MASNYSEYSRMRSIARKRSERLVAAGLAQTVRFPTVKELKAKGVSPAAAMRSVSSFLSSPTTVKEYKKIEVSLPEHIRILFINIRDDMFALMYALITVMYNYIIF